MRAVHAAWWIAIAFPRESFQQVPSANAAAGKLCSFSHQIENCIFTLAADYRQTAYIDQQFASLQVPARILPGGGKFAHPGFAEFSFHNQLALCPRVDIGNPEHLGSHRVSARRMPKPKGAQNAERNGESKISSGFCQRVSKSKLTFVRLQTNDEL